MARTTSVTTGALPSIATYIWRTGLAVAMPLLCFEKYGQSISMPSGSGKTITFRRFEKLPPIGGAGDYTATTPSRVLVEGTTPDNVTPTVTDIVFSLTQLGAYYQYSDISGWVNEVSVDQNLMARTGENMAEVVDYFYRDSILGGSRFYRILESTNNTSTPSRVLIAGKIAKALPIAVIGRDLFAADAKTVKPMKGSSDGFGTSAVRESFVAVAHPDLCADLDAITPTVVNGSDGFTPVAKYGSLTDLLPGEYGTLKNVRFIQSTHGKIWAGAGAAVGATGLKATGGQIDVYGAVVTGKDAYCCVKFSKDTGKVIYVSADSNSKYDPLNQFSVLGWKATVTGGILNDAWLKRLECGVTA